jgi:hypothetical protein
MLAAAAFSSCNINYKCSTYKVISSNHYDMIKRLYYLCNPTVALLNLNPKDCEFFQLSRHQANRLKKKRRDI